MKYLYQRILIKLSGELFGGKGRNVDLGSYEKVAKELAAVVKEKVQVAVVVGGGNIMRGRSVKGTKEDELAGHRAGMVATVVNGIFLTRAFERNGVHAKMVGSFPIPGMVEPHDPRAVKEDLSDHEVIVYVGGTGLPFVSTDSACVVRALETGAQAFFKVMKDVDGVYSTDPKKSRRAVKYPSLTFEEAIGKRLGVMDLAAFELARKHRIPIHVFKWSTGRFLRVLRGEKIGSVVS
ncbi:MAG: UMP kinase [Patescibacteria group bacterium]